MSEMGLTPMCASCARLNRASRTLSCEAYPDGIPDGIVENKVDHRVPQPGDRGLRFVLAPGEEAQAWWPADGESG